MRNRIATILVLSCSLAFASAQPEKPAGPEKWDIFVGYSLERAYLSSADLYFPAGTFPMTLNGGQASATYFFNKHLGATAEMTGYTNEKLGGTYTSEGYLFGPTWRFGPRDSRYSFFVHQLFGVSHISLKIDSGETCPEDGTSGQACTSKPFTMTTGGGVDVKLGKHLSVRPAQLEYFGEHIDVDATLGLPSSAFGGLKVAMNVFRYSAGAVVRF